jgi:PAS domain S-box-containing protein
MNEDSIRGLIKVLATENDRMEMVLDSMLDAIIVCGDDHVPLIVNKAAERLLPLRPAELLEGPFWRSVGDDEMASFFERSMNNEETVLDREFAVDTKTGTRILSISITPLVRDRRIQGTLIHVEETTDKRRREARLRRAESLASLTTLAAGVAHEIKNPLGSISIHVQLIRKALGGCEGEHVHRYIDIVNEEIERLNAIVVDFLFAVRPMNIAPINDDANVLVRELSEFMSKEIEEAGVALHVELDAGLPPLPFDRRYLKQALLNLVKNALAAMPGGGSLDIRTRYSGDDLRIIVKDSGIGIPEDRQSKIFEPYYTTKENGTGLGLTLSYKIIKEHGGDITLRSKPGLGSEFTVSLPVPQKDQRMITDRKQATATNHAMPGDTE